MSPERFVKGESERTTVPFPPGLIWSLSDLSSAFFERRFVHDSKPLLTSGWESILWRLAL